MSIEMDLYLWFSKRIKFKQIVNILINYNYNSRFLNSHLSLKKLKNLDIMFILLNLWFYRRMFLINFNYKSSFLNFYFWFYRGKEFKIIRKKK